LLFYCHFKILFKLVQIGLSVKRVKNIQRKLDNENNSITELKNEFDDESAVLDELNTANTMRNEAQRIQDNEIYVLTEKRNNLTARI
jgi:hypothetical protein